MNTSAAEVRIQEVRTTDDELLVAFVDGRTLSVPLVWYPRLFCASPEQRSEWRLIGDGDGVHWPQIDEDLSAAGLLRGVTTPAVRDLSPLEGSSAQGGHDIAKGPVHVTPREDGQSRGRATRGHRPYTPHREKPSRRVDRSPARTRRNSSCTTSKAKFGNATATATTLSR